MVQRFPFSLILLLIIASLLSSCSRLTYIPVREPLPVFSPPDISAFQPGDIVLTYPMEPVSWLMSLMSSSNPEQIKNPYNHGELVFVDENGQKMLGGFSGRVMSAPLGSRMEQFHKVVVLRNTSLNDYKMTLAEKMAQFTHDSRLQHAKFDYSFRDVPGRINKFYCLGLINEAHRQVGAPIPFPHKPIQRNSLLIHVEELLKTEIRDGPIIEDLFSNPNYEIVLEWTNNQHKYFDSWLTEYIARYTVDIYEHGWRLKQSDETAINLYLWLFDDSDEALDPVKRILWSFKKFHREAGIDWEKLSTAGKLEGLTQRQKVELLKMIGEKYRDEFFERKETKLVGRQ